MAEKKFRTLLSLIINNVIAIIVEKEQMNELEAVQSFYTSETYAMLEREATKFWWFSPEALYEEYIMNKLGDAL